MFWLLQVFFCFFFFFFLAVNLRAILWEHQKILETHSHGFEWNYDIWVEGQKLSIESGISFSKCPLVSIATGLEVMKILIF